MKFQKFFPVDTTMSIAIEVIMKEKIKSYEGAVQIDESTNIGSHPLLEYVHNKELKWLVLKSLYRLFDKPFLWQAEWKDLYLKYGK